ncbi:MAG TPA: YggT family protein [Acidimicrobiales bacterium]
MRELLCKLVWLYVAVIVVRMVLSWFPLQPGGLMAKLQRVLIAVTDPVLAPLRRIIPPVGGLDLSPLVALLFLQIVVAGLILRC